MTTDTRLALLAAVFGGVAAAGGVLAAVAGFWTAAETRRQANIGTQEAQVDRTGVLVRHCTNLSTDEMHDGQDIITIAGKTGEFQYTADDERPDLLTAVSSAPTFHLERLLTNPTRVPLLTVTFYANVSFAHDKQHEEISNDIDPIPVLEAGETKRVWIEDATGDPITFHEPYRVTYYTFPDFTHRESQRLLPTSDDYWILSRENDPEPNNVYP